VLPINYFALQKWGQLKLDGSASEGQRMEKGSGGERKKKKEKRMGQRKLD